MQDCVRCKNHSICRLEHRNLVERCAFVNPTDEIPIIHGKAELELHDKEIRNNAVDEFAEQLKERLKGMQMAEIQGEDVCPYGEKCPYINSDLGCQYCAREETIKDIDEIAEQLKAGGVSE